MRALALCLLAVPAYAQQDAILKRVDDHYNHLASLRMHYVERYDGMGMQRAETGTLLLKRPGRMLWRYDTPAGKVFVLDGKDAWFYTPGDSQAQHMPAKKLDDLRTPLRFLLGHTQLVKELDHIRVTPAEGGFRIEGAPKTGAGGVQRLVLQVDAAGAIRQMTLEQAGGATTTFVFDQIAENIPARDVDFHFMPPAGVSVVEALPPV